ncbi:hypothetical protein M0638_23895 [Roseomonas sp. NAR14]|uniref:Uncharacterized protein n=1 Tax=Roseomonas acroporae TaxID=2937791 RepID=A0A9X1YCT3_9PROT|nr:hypothetical protein [Roseomonas acroporae]MCK8787417.1 hypothetical protein [Roseomonas acroporae]
MFRPSRRAAAVVAVALGLAALPAAAQQPQSYAGSAATGWTDLGGTREQCIATATAVVRGAGFIPDAVPPGNSTLFAGRNGDLAVVRCIADRRVISVTVHLLNEGDPLETVNRIVAAFTDGGQDSPPPGRQPPPQQPQFQQQQPYQPQPYQQQPYQQQPYQQQPGFGGKPPPSVR